MLKVCKFCNRITVDTVQVCIDCGSVEFQGILFESEDEPEQEVKE